MRRAAFALALAGAGALVACAGAPCARRDPSPSSAPRRCEPLACPRGATPHEGRCRCEHGTPAFLGACGDGAERVCGKASTVSGGGCAMRTCAPGEALDAEQGACVGPAALRALAERMQIAVEPDEGLACADGSRLLTSADWASCVADEACGAGAQWSASGKRCEPIGACPPGELRGERGGRCVPVVFPAPEGHEVDVAAWARWVLGPDGGTGSSFLCGALAARPWTVTHTTDFDVPVDVALRLRFPDNDVTQARVELEASAADAIVLQTLEPLVGRLRALGGTARASTVDLRIRCVLPLRSRPRPAPPAAR